MSYNHVYRTLFFHFCLQFAPKSFVDPRLCLVAYNHYCLGLLNSSPPMRLMQVSVSPMIARSHHYRRCPFGNYTCRLYFGNQTQDNELLKYKRKLQPAVEQVLRDTGHSEVLQVWSLVLNALQLMCTSVTELCDKLLPTNDGFLSFKFTVIRASLHHCFLAELYAGKQVTN